MAIELKRDIYTDLLRWKERRSGHVLELEGARQVGKTYILDKFARENYSQYIYINIIASSGRKFMKYLHELSDKPLHEVLAAYVPGFRDSEDTIIVIDEIQEAAPVYSAIREFAREFACDIIVTGSYLGKTREKDFFLSAGDTDNLELYTLSFAEFLDAFGKRDLYSNLSLFGDSPYEQYNEIREYFDLYCQIGGYPKVVQTYLETRDIPACRREVAIIIDVFIRESSRYFESAIELDLFGKMFSSIAISLVKEKKGTNDFTSDLSKIIFKEESSRISKKMTNAAISWLYLSHVIGYCSKSIDCNYLEIVDNCRFYFRDLGIAYYYLRKTGEREQTIKGILCENFVYLDLLDRIKTTDSIAGDAPWFAIEKQTGGELDFYVRSLGDYKNYGVEVKAGDNSGKTVTLLLNNGKLDYVYYLKGDTHGGQASNGKVLTVPIYLAGRVSYCLG